MWTQSMPLVGGLIAFCVTVVPTSHSGSRIPLKNAAGLNKDFFNAWNYQDNDKQYLTLNEKSLLYIYKQGKAHMWVYFF